MNDNLLPDDAEHGSLEIKIEDRAKTNEFNEDIIPKKNRKSKKLIIILIIIIMAIISGIFFS